MVILSGLGATAINVNNAKQENNSIEKIQSTSISFSSSPTFLEKEGYLSISINGANSVSLESEKPALPIYVQTIQLPIGAKNIKVVCTPKGISTIELSKPVMPAQIFALSKAQTAAAQAIVKNEAVYASTEYYPNNWYSYRLGAGRDSNDKPTIFVTIICHVARYSPANNKLDYANGFDIKVTYTAPSLPTNTLDSYDLVIIGPAAFESTIKPLVDHKVSKGVKTLFKSVEDILNEYQGVDEPEQIKYFIKYAYDTWGITYVLLFGGLKSHIRANDKDDRSHGATDWYVPVRYANIVEFDEKGCLSDLYFGDLYDANGNFSSWDSNGDGIYAAWGAGLGVPDDTLDLYPEVYVGRLPVSSKFEARLMVKKIIRYESTGPEQKPWYGTFVGVGGKTFEYYEGKPDGEYLCDLAIENMGNIVDNPVWVYSTNRDTGGLTPIAKDITGAISKGAGYVDFEGHGNPLVWDTIWFDGTYPDDWCGGVTLYHFLKLTNAEKLPVIVVGGCHNALFNVTALGTILDKEGTRYYCYGLPAPVCFSWGFVVKPRGGAIASTGCTGYGIGYEGDPVSLSGELESNFFYQIGQNGSANLGSAHSGAIRKFISEEQVGKTEAFCITNWQLFGDPSLKLGGYSS